MVRDGCFQMVNFSCPAFCIGRRAASNTTTPANQPKRGPSPARTKSVPARVGCTRLSAASAHMNRC